jgi:hypothetical protein
MIEIEIIFVVGFGAWANNVDRIAFMRSCGRDWRFMTAFNGYRKRLKGLDIPKPL